MTPGMKIKGNEAEILIGVLEHKIKQIEERGVTKGSLLCSMDTEQVETTDPWHKTRRYKPGNRELFSATWEYEKDGA